MAHADVKIEQLIGHRYECILASAAGVGIQSGRKRLIISTQIVGSGSKQSATTYQVTVGKDDELITTTRDLDEAVTSYNEQ